MAIIYTIENYGIQSSSLWCTDQERQHQIATQLRQENFLSEFKLGKFDTENVSEMKDGIRFKQWAHGNIVYDCESIDKIDDTFQSLCGNIRMYPENYSSYDASFIKFASDETLPNRLETTKTSRHAQTIMIDEISQKDMAQFLLEDLADLGVYIDEPEHIGNPANGTTDLNVQEKQQETVQAFTENEDKPDHDPTTEIFVAETMSAPATEKYEVFTEDTEARTEDNSVESVSVAPDFATAHDEKIHIFHLDDDEPGDDASVMFVQTGQAEQAESPKAHIVATETPPASGTNKVRQDLSATGKPHKETLDADQPEAASQQSVPPRQQTQQGQQQMMSVPPPGLVTRLVQALLGGIGSISMPGNHTEPQIRRALEPSVEERLLWSRQKQAINHMLVLEDRLESCKEQYNAIRRNPVFNSALEQVQNGSLDPKDFFLTLARSSRTGKQEYHNLDTAIQSFSSSISEMGTLVRQVERSCSRADIDSSKALGSVGSFLNDLKDDPASSLMPNETADATLADSVKEMIASLMKLFRKADAEEEEDGPSLAF